MQQTMTCMMLVVLLIAVLGQHGIPTVQARISLEGTPLERPTVDDLAPTDERGVVCEHPLRDALSGSFLDSLPEEAEDALMDILNKEYPCESSGLDLPGWEDLVDAVYGLPFFDKERLDCSVRRPEHADPYWAEDCRLASLLDADRACIPASAFEQWGCLELDVDAKLCDDNRPFNMTVYLSTSGSSGDDVELDCNGQTIDHGWQDGMRKYPGMRTPYTYSVSNIRINNCHIRNTGKYGIDLKRFFRGTQLDGPIEGHRHITIANTSIANTEQIGIYVGQNSQHVAIRNVAIDNAYKGGIYLEAGSTHTHISGASITKTREREAIAVDSSQYNLIEFSTFSGNEGGGINLYKNCGENFGQVCPIQRPLSASHNVLRFNEFQGDGVNVAWRQFKWYGFDFCAGIDVSGYWRDRASHNLIHGNRFYDTKVDVQDGPNTVYANEFISTELELGKGQPWGWVDQPIAIDGSVAENVFDEESTIDFATTGVFDDLELFNNHDANGECFSLQDKCLDWFGSSDPAGLAQCLALQNECRGPTVLPGTEARSAGVITALFP